MNMSWQDQARSLPIGSSRKIICCGSDPSTYISNSLKGLSLGPCFRCGFREFVPLDSRSLAELSARRRAAEAVLDRSASIPGDSLPLNQAPPEAIVWALRGGLTPEKATEQYGFKWHEKSGKVLIPVNRGFIARAIDGSKPKYRDYGDTKGIFTLLKDGSVLVVVEDVLSCIRVHSAGFSSCALLGTNIPRLPTAERYVGWFDPDKAGTGAYVRLRKVLALTDAKLVRVRSAKDPKYYSTRQIKVMVEEAINE